MLRWTFGAVQYSQFDGNGFLGIQIDPTRGDGDVGAASVSEVQPPYGFFHRPRDPDSDGRGCSVLTMQRGNRQRYAWLGSDPRAVELTPNVNKGSAGMAVLTDSNEISLYEVDGETGTHTIYIPDGDSAHFVQIGVDDNGASTLKLQHSEGMAIVMFEGAVTIHNAAGDAYWELNADGTTINGALKNYGGLEAGGDGALPLVLHPAFASALGTFCSAINAIVPATGAPDSGAAVLAQLKVAASALSAALAGTASVLIKGK